MMVFLLVMAVPAAVTVFMLVSLYRARMSSRR